MPIKIDTVYRTKKAAQERYKRILASYKHGQCVGGPDFDAVIDLMNEVSDKWIRCCGLSTDDIVDVEVCRIKIVPVTNYSYSKVFEVWFRNGDEYDRERFSYINAMKWICTHTAGLTPEKKFKEACRHVVQQYNDEFKQRYFTKGHNYAGGYINWRAQCQECGGSFPYGKMDVDHQEPYFIITIIQQFIHINNIDMKRILYDNEYNQNVIFFKDMSLVKRFSDYHTQHANLRVICKKCNNDPKLKPVRNNERKQLFITATEKVSGLSLNEPDNTKEREQFLKLLEAAEQGDTDAQYEVARCYQFGMGVEQDDYQCFRWLCECDTEAAQAAYPDLCDIDMRKYIMAENEHADTEWEHEEFKIKRYHRQPNLFDRKNGRTAPEPARPIVQRRLRFN